MEHYTKSLTASNEPSNLFLLLFSHQYAKDNIPASQIEWIVGELDSIALFRL